MKITLLPVQEEDCKEIWIINNDPTVRATSFSPDTITFREHQIWFQKKLSDKNFRLFKCSIKGKVVGQVRLDIERKQASIDVAVKKQFRGKGIGCEILRLTINLAKELKLKILLAEINKQTNLH